jgi:multidrug efflux pump subunit AcrA (membrane-fusion protein)
MKMKTVLPWILTAILAAALVVVVVARPDVAPAAAPQKTALYWVDPMHPSYKSGKPGKAPDCGMDLVPVYEETKPLRNQQLIGVAIGIAEVRDLGRAVRTVGRVAVDETRLSKVSTKFDGYIEKLYVNATGQSVRRGQPLFTVYSPDLLASQQEYLLALRAAQQSPSLLEAARQRLLLWDVTASDLRELERTGKARKSLTIVSPASGVVMNKTAVEGARVMPGEPLFEIADLDRAWVQADVYESELPYVAIGAPATVALSYIPGRTWRGRVAFIAPAVDPLTRTVKVRIELDNRDAALKPDMFADVTIQQPPRRTIVVPDSAVLMTGTRSIVFIARSDGTFEPREVSVGTKAGGYYEIRTGVEPGTKVVTQANFLIDSEARLKSALARMKQKPTTDNRQLATGNSQP